MTVGELIKELEKLDPNLVVNVGTHDVYPTVHIELFTVLPGFPDEGQTQVSISASV